MMQNLCRPRTLPSVILLNSSYLDGYQEYINSLKLKI